MLESKKRPGDLSQLAYRIMFESSGQAEFNPGQPNPLAPSENASAIALERLGGIVNGGGSKAGAPSPKRRSQIAAKAAAKRWGKK